MRGSCTLCFSVWNDWMLGSLLFGPATTVVTYFTYQAISGWLSLILAHFIANALHRNSTDTLWIYLLFHNFHAYQEHQQTSTTLILKDSLISIQWQQLQSETHLAPHGVHMNQHSTDLVYSGQLVVCPLTNYHKTFSWQLVHPQKLVEDFAECNPTRPILKFFNRSVALVCPRNCESKYLDITLWVVLSQNLIIISICSCCNILFKDSSNEITNLIPGSFSLENNIL